MSQDILVTIDTQQTAFVTVDTERVSEVAAIGIQGLAAVDKNLEELLNVEAIDAVDGSVLVLDAERGKWVATRILEKQDIDGGRY
jgi:hypothetical protein